MYADSDTLGLELLLTMLLLLKVMMHLPKEWTLIKMFLKQENNEPDSRDKF